MVIINKEVQERNLVEPPVTNSTNHILVFSPIDILHHGTQEAVTFCHRLVYDIPNKKNSIITVNHAVSAK